VTTPELFAPWEEAARRAGISGRALEDYYFEMLKQKRGPLMQSTKEAFVALIEKMNQAAWETNIRLELGPDTKDGFRISSVGHSRSPMRQVWFTLSGTTEILASRRDSLQGDCGNTFYHASDREDLVLVEKDSRKHGVNEIAESYCRWMLADG